MHQRPEISPIAAIATAVWWMRSSGGKTEPSPRYAPGSSMRSGSSSGCLALPGALPRAQQEYPSPAGDLRPGQSVHGAPPFIALPTGVICPTASLMVANAADLTLNNATHSDSVTGYGNFNDGYPSQLLVQTLLNARHRMTFARIACIRVTQEPNKIRGGRT